MRYGRRPVRALGEASLGKRHADMIITGCSLVNVYTREIQEGMQVAISGQRIAYVGPDASHAVSSGTKVIDAGGNLVSPGFAEPHMHIDQLATPAETADRLLLRGTTSVFSDPIDIVGVAGYRGFREFVRMTSDTSIRIFNVVPGGLPVDAKFGNAKRLTPEEESEAMTLDGVLGLGEVFSWTKVTMHDPDTVSTLERMLEGDRVINGHTAGASGKKLQAYISAGVMSCHEPISFEQVRERLRLGMWIMIREGSIRRDLDEIVSGVLDSGIGTERMMFCADELNPEDLSEYGHIDHCVRRAVSLGMDAADAVSMASRNCFEYYMMGRDLGGVAPGRVADIIIFDGSGSFRPDTVIVGGRVAVRGGSILTRSARKSVPEWLKRTVSLPELSAEDFAVRTKEEQVRVNAIHLNTEIVTSLESLRLHCRDGNVAASRDRDVWKVAAFDRSGTGRRAVGFLERFGAEIGAFASTKSFHENDLVVIGADEREMALAANHLIRTRGGMVVVKDGKVAAEMPFEIGGIMSSGTFERVREEFAGVNRVITDSGCVFARPTLIPVFLPFLAIPSVRIMHDGMVDVRRRTHLPVIQ